MTDKNEKKSNLGCLIYFIVCAIIGIGMALRDDEIVNNFGRIPIVILGVIGFYFLYKHLNNN